MSPRARVRLLVALAAAVTAAGAVALAIASRDDSGRRGREGKPPLALDLGLRADREARDLRRAAALYEADRFGAARRVFERYRSPAARVGAAFARWPQGSLRELEALAEQRPRDPLVLLHLGLARFWSGEERAAVAAWRATQRANADTLSAVRAGDLLHPDTPPGLPQFVPSSEPFRSLARLPPAGQLRALRQRARLPDLRAKLWYGVALQRLGRPRSAARVFAEAARLFPRSADAQTAAAIARFEKDRPARAFSRLGPLTRRFPGAPTVRYHLGLALLWLGSVDEAREQLRRARALGPSSPLGREANRLLRRLEGVRRGSDE